MKKILITIVCLLLISGCSAMQKKADGHYFDIASNNNSEASIILEKVIVDGEWSSNATGTMGCGDSNINGASGIASPSYNAIAPQEYIYLEWYSWLEGARMKAKIMLPDSNIINELLLSPPWHSKGKKGIHRSKFIIDFRPDHKIWVKLAKSANPKSQDEIMILAEGQGIKTNDIVKDYIYFEEDEDYTSDCISKRKRLKKLGYYTAPLVVYDKWYPGALQNKEE